MKTTNNLYGFPAGNDLSHANMPLVSRKRPREQEQPYNCINNNSSATPFTFLGQDFSSLVERDKLQLDRLITHHMEKVRLELEARGRRYAGRMISAAGESMMKKLKLKDEEIQKIGKINFALVERVRSLAVVNQIWKDLAQTNEATVNALRINLVQVLHIMHKGSGGVGGAEDLIDESRSCCGSNYEEEVGRRILADNVVQGSGINGVNGRGEKSMFCRNCGKGEACVLLLPCRHLCLCGVCGSSVHVCPICNCAKSCSLLVNMSG